MVIICFHFTGEPPKPRPAPGAGSRSASGPGRSSLMLVAGPCWPFPPAAAGPRGGGVCKQEAAPRGKPPHAARSAPGRRRTVPHRNQQIPETQSKGFCAGAGQRLAAATRLSEPLGLFVDGGRRICLPQAAGAASAACPSSSASPLPPHAPSELVSCPFPGGSVAEGTGPFVLESDAVPDRETSPGKHVSSPMTTTQSGPSREDGQLIEALSWNVQSLT